FVGKHIASQSQINRPTASARHAVAAPTGMDKTDIQFREAREYVCFSESRVQALIRDAVAVEHDPVAILEGKVFRTGLQGDACDKTKCPNHGGAFHAGRFTGFGLSAQPGFASASCSS